MGRFCLVIELIWRGSVASMATLSFFRLAFWSFKYSIKKASLKSQIFWCQQQTVKICQFCMHLMMQFSVSRHNLIYMHIMDKSKSVKNIVTEDDRIWQALPSYHPSRRSKGKTYFSISLLQLGWSALKHINQMQSSRNYICIPLYRSNWVRRSMLFILTLQ